MLRHMRTTMIINDELYRQVKERAHAEARTVTSFVEAALRERLSRLDSPHAPAEVFLAPPTGDPGSAPLVDLGDPKTVSRLLDEEDVDHYLEVLNRTPRT